MAKYVGINITSNEHAKVLFVTDNERAALLGRLYMLQHPGQKVVAPPLEGRSFSKFEKELNQYLFWNSFQQTPPEDYSLLLKSLVLECEKIQVSETDLPWLKAELANYNYDVELTTTGHNYVMGKVPNPPRPKVQKEQTEKKEKVPKEPKAPRAEGEPIRPKPNSTCGIIWQVLDEQYENEKDFKELKKICQEILVQKEGINASTFSVQFTKWKNQISS